jgi:ethanolamine ammonia-lyase small subunit
MSTRARPDWSRRIDQVVRSQRYTLVAEGLSGEPIEKAITDITADLMHLCRRQGVNFEQLLVQSRKQVDQEEQLLPLRKSA